MARISLLLPHLIIHNSIAVSKDVEADICEQLPLSHLSLLGMCLKENYSDSPSNEYLRHYSAESESEYLRRQNMNSKLGEEQKKKKKEKAHRVRRSPNFDSNSDKKQKNRSK